MQHATSLYRILGTLAFSLLIVLATGCDSGGGMDDDEEEPPPETNVEDVRINEIHEDEQWAELYNTGDASVDAAELWLCAPSDCVQLSDLNVVAGNTEIAADGFLVVEWDAVQQGAGELGLYETDDFDSADALLGYVQYGADEQGRADVAVEAGIWTDGAFVPATAEGQTLAFLGGGDAPVDNWGFGTPTQGAENAPTDLEAVQYALAANANDGEISDGVSATVTFQALGDAQTLVTLELDDGPTGTQFVHPAHIHLNDAAEGGGIEVYLAPIDGLDQPANPATSSQVVDLSLDELLRFDGHVNIHESNANLGNVIAQGDVGANARGTAVEAVPLADDPQSVTYELEPVSNDGEIPDGVAATVTFQELGGDQTLVTLALDDGPAGEPLGHPSHIHENSAAEGGGIQIFLAPIDGLDQPANPATSSQIVDRSYDELVSFDGHVNIHESNANLGNVIAQGDVGANAEGNGGDGDGNGDDGGDGSGGSGEY